MGAYIAGERVIDAREREESFLNSQKGLYSDAFRFWALSASFTNNQYRFYRPDLSVDSLKFSKFEPFNGFKVGFSRFFITESKSENTIIAGYSINYILNNNYSTLKKIEGKNNYQINFGSDSTDARTIQVIDDDGYVYAVQKGNSVFKKFGELMLRGQYGIIPKFTGRSICFITYPEIVYSKSKVSANLGFGIQLLKKGNPLISTAGIFFKFSDILNSKDDEDPFFKRSFELGVTASLNVLTQ